ncbi:phosphohistidine phosphatase SixA [Synechocystis sp. LKSZ1]|uniref:phosphohistidine phosphatase SixA n=1 Tax=Synechocystis sp. LKSZ1 TaxID=3144951 RepID=UPI00336BE661
MKLYLIRHGIAADRLDYDQDAERPLTRKGEIKTQQVALQLQNRGLVVDAILSSPLSRAQQTAQILLAAGLSHHLETHDTLAPGGLLQDWLNWLTASSYNQADSKLALVGHQPDLGAWAESLVWGQFQDKLILKKAGIIGLSLPDSAASLGNAQMFLLLSPRWIL